MPASDLWFMLGLAALFAPAIFLIWRMLRRKGHHRWAMVYGLAMTICMLWLVGGTLLTYWFSRVE